jgi:hypothetical protein
MHLPKEIEEAALMIEIVLLETSAIKELREIELQGLVEIEQ